MNKWELARYLIDAKKCVDRVLFIAQNAENLPPIDLRFQVYEAKAIFYVNCGVILDKAFPKKKKEICVDPEVEAIYYERDKNSAHKDENYQPHDYSSLQAIADELKAQLEKVRHLCNKALPQELTLDFVPHDPVLFRLLHGITKEKENQILDRRFPNRNSMPVPDGGREYPLFTDTEDLRLIPEECMKDYAVLMSIGICMEEDIQKLQDACIRINALHNQNIWVELGSENLKKQKQLRAAGLYDCFDTPVEPKDEANMMRRLHLLLKINGERQNISDD